MPNVLIHKRPACSERGASADSVAIGDAWTSSHNLRLAVSGFNPHHPSAHRASIAPGSRLRYVRCQTFRWPAALTKVIRHSRLSVPKAGRMAEGSRRSPAGEAHARGTANRPPERVVMRLRSKRRIPVCREQALSPSRGSAPVTTDPGIREPERAERAKRPL